MCSLGTPRKEEKEREREKEREGKGGVQSMQSRNTLCLHLWRCQCVYNLMVTGALEETVRGEFYQSASNGHVMSGVTCTGKEDGLQECIVEKWGSEGRCDLPFAGVVCKRKWSYHVEGLAIT